MDDVRAFQMSLKMGWRWMDGGLCFTESWRLEDEMTGMTSTRRTGQVLVQSMNEVLSFLRFTLDIGDDFEDGKLPSLDRTFWVERRTPSENDRNSSRQDGGVQEQRLED